jgi:hypothetical protein
MKGAEERRLRRISNTPQGEASEGNTADDALMVDQGHLFALTELRSFAKGMGKLRKLGQVKNGKEKSHPKTTTKRTG